MPSLHAHLQGRMGSAYRRLQESLAGLSAADAVAGARAEWRRYRFGVGLDGSIQGIVRHVASWKLAAAKGLVDGGFPDAEGLLPARLSWETLLAVLDEGQQQLTAALAQLSEEGLDDVVTWEGHSLPVHVVLAHLIEHDQYHAGQINLLRQQRGHELE